MPNVVKFCPIKFYMKRLIRFQKIKKLHYEIKMSLFRKVDVILYLILVNIIPFTIVQCYDYDDYIIEEKNLFPSLQSGPVEEQTKILTSKEKIKQLLEEKYKFKNDQTSRRFKVTKDVSDFQDEPESEDDQVMVAFRSYAARRIVGGMETSISMYPYNVAISRIGRHWCGGSLIDEQWTISAGHCFESAYGGSPHKLTPYIIRAGSSFHNRGGYQARVNKVFFPDDYSPGSADFDYSLVRLDRPMPIGRNIAVLNLPSRDYQVRIDDLLIVTGWGSTHESGAGHIPDRLRFVPVPVMRQSLCQNSYRFYITKRMMCAGFATGGKDACNHDSGGPAVRDGVLLGIVSFGGKQCGDPDSPGVYSRVSEITDWVERTVANNEANKVPELIPKIKMARLRERELQRFKSKVEEKQQKIKNFLRKTLQSSAFFQYIKQKLKASNKQTRRSRGVLNSSFLDEKAMDEINLANLIHDIIIIGDGENNESEMLLRTLALNEILLNEKSEELRDILHFKTDDDTLDSREEILKVLVAYIS